MDDQNNSSFSSGKRDNFSAGVKAILANRAGFRCSKPSCRALTVGPSAESPDSRTNIGVASHITAASVGGPRFDSTLTSEERCSAKNGIWLCQIHGKEIDDDIVSFSPDVLRAWKQDAEKDAQELLGRPISAQSIDVSIQVSLHRADDGAIVVTGNTNLPDGTRLWVELFESGSKRLFGQVDTKTNEGMFAATGFLNHGVPYAHGWYTIEALAYFNGPWGQSDAVLSIVGEEGEYLIGRFAEPLHPELSESEKRFRAEFECIAPPLKEKSNRTNQDLIHAIDIVQNAVLTVDGRRSALSIGDNVESYMKAPGLRKYEGWAARALSNGAVVVSFSYWNGNKSAFAEWTVIIDNKEVRYRNLSGKYMSWAPDY
jgi:hypothetical protein